MLIAIPTGVKIFNWIFTMWGGSIRFTTAMKFAIALIAMFTIGGISGITHASPPSDLQQTDTYYIVAHFHYVLYGGAIMGIFAGIYHYFPKWYGRKMDEKLGNWHFWLNFIAFNLTFFPMHYAGMLGMPRRIYTYDAGQGWETFNLISSVGAFLMAPAFLIFFYNFFRSKTKRRNRGRQSVGCGHARVVDSLAAAGVQLRADPDGDVALPAVGPDAPGAHGRHPALRGRLGRGQAPHRRTRHDGRQARSRCRADAHRDRAKDGEGTRHLDAEPDDQAAVGRRRASWCCSRRCRSCTPARTRSRSR